jgi:hydroxypyruvate isomerase
VRTHGLRFDVNCSILFTELPLLKRPGAARAAGFGAVEFWWPFTDPVPADREVDAFTGALADAGVQLALLNFAGGDMAAGDRGLLALPERSAAFRDNIEVCVGIAARTGCTILNALYGNRADGLSRQQQDELAAENLALAAQAAAGADATVVVEALNSYDSPHPDRGRPGPRRPRHGRTGLRGAVRSARQAGVCRLDRLRVQADRPGGQLDELRLEGTR